jgi:hypothetical protein
MYLFIKKATWMVRALAVCLSAVMLLQLFVPAANDRVFAANEGTQPEPANGYLDKLDFGNADSESAHNLKGAFTSVITGFMGETARVSNLCVADGEKQGFKFKPDQNPDNMLAPDLTDAEKQALIDGYVQDQVKRN